MDTDTRTLIERTRQRREILNQRFAGMPEAAPRKRRTPVLEDAALEKVATPNAPQDDSPKRQCLRDVEVNIKPDTPAIRGVKSRIADLRTGEDENSLKDDDVPTPKPRQSVSSPPLERKSAISPSKQAAPSADLGSARKSRFAALARDINNWEDDLTHHVVHKEEEKKPRWQPPVKKSDSPSKSAKSPAPSGQLFAKTSTTTPTKTASSGLPSKSPGRAYAADSSSVRSGVVSSSPVKGLARSEIAARGSPSKTGGEVVASPKKTVAPPVPVSSGTSSPASAFARNSPLRGSKEAPASFSASVPGASSVSSRGGPTASSSEPAITTKSVTPGPSKVLDPAELPVSQRMSQMQEKLAKKQQEEPTAYSVGARMSAWEDMTLANKVSDIKKVDPGQSTPRTRPVSGYTPATTATPKAVPVSNTSQNGPPPPPPPPPMPTHSPTKVSQGTKGVQQLLAQRVNHSETTCSQMASQSRAERAAELAALSNRWKNGILKEDSSDDALESNDDKEVKQKTQQPKTPSGRREAAREKARADFNSKLAEIGLGAAEDTPSDPAPLKAGNSKGTTSSIYNLIKKRDEATPTKQEESKKVKFNDSFDDSGDELESKIPKCAVKRMMQSSAPSSNHQQQDNDIEEEEDEKVTFKKPTSLRKKTSMEEDDDTESVASDRASVDISDDDISLRGFVSEAVRRESIFGTRGARDSSSSLDSYSADAGDRTEDSSRGGSRSDTAKGGYHADDDTVDDDDDDMSDDDGDKRKAVNDLLDDAFDDTMMDDESSYDPDMDVNNVVMRKKHVRMETNVDDDYDPDMDINNVVLRKKPKQQSSAYSAMVSGSTDDDGDDRPYSIQAYRKSATIHKHTLEPVVRSSKYVGRNVVEEDIPTMPQAAPQAAPRADDRRAVQDRIRELKELVQQEQSVIMQTSNALNKCCVGNPMFAGSSEQVECNRLLLLACQKRQCYMTEIERLKATAQLSHDGPGPRGSITISDIRLPLKKDFVTKIGTSHDTTTHYFILLIRNGSQLICTQMLSTHDPMMRGSLDFPNLIKINGITANFRLTLDIYGMSVSREPSGKGKNKTPKKTPKKNKGFPMESPGGPTAVRTTSFSHVTSLELTKKSLDKSSFHLERLSYLSPLYGQIFMRLKCLMESNVEERGFLTMFDDVSGFGAWHRRWCVLTGNKLCIWKYPDDETRKDPMSVIDLKRCVSEKIGLVSRDICARPHTFEMVTVRQGLKGEHDTLVTRTYNSTTSVRHLVSADSKEERIVWCNKINRTLANLRTWNADALKPMRPPPSASHPSSSRR